MEKEMADGARVHGPYTSLVLLFLFLHGLHFFRTTQGLRETAPCNPPSGSPLPQASDSTTHSTTSVHLPCSIISTSFPDISPLLCNAPCTAVHCCQRSAHGRAAVQALLKIACSALGRFGCNSCATCQPVAIKRSACDRPGKRAALLVVAASMRAVDAESG